MIVGRALGASKVLRLCALLAAIAAPGLAAAEGDPRDEVFFGEAEPPARVPSTASRDDAIFGGGDSRDAAVVGGDVGDSRDAAFFGDGGGDSRDDDFFGDGGDTISASAPADRPSTTEEQRDEGRLLSSGEIDRRLGLRENKLDVGGLLYLRMDYGAAEKGIAEGFPISNPNLLDLYLDARPTDRLRAFVRGRVTHYFLNTDVTDDVGQVKNRGGTTGGLDQLWLKFDIDRTVFVTAGRQPIRWGAGRFWNPTDFLNIQRRDPLAVIDERFGVSLLKFHLPDEADGWNFYAIANLENATRPDEVGGALRVEKLVGTTEVSVSFAARKDRPIQVGGDITFPLGPLDLRAEGALSRGGKAPFFRGPVSVDPLVLPTTYSRENEWIPQAVLGAELGIAYGDDDSITLGAEYFYNGAGYDDSALYPWLMISGAFTPLYLGKHYGAVYASAVGPGSWNDTTLVASLLGNLSDGSLLARFDWRVRLLTFLDANAFVGYHFGSDGELHFGLDLPPIDLPEGNPAAPLVANGLHRAAPFLDLGAGLSLRF
ncbi:hypothetical protein [Vulgatibacter incomptus]|uniref:Uncharacterized protein n=1 Tax=Vulgatibacter incomptus TaxID=1391653 RepID=A0A0K1PF89_9BACT|nr:hypothetical protein [Vulgatibacter incomptus]AKU92185.1 hypothetical protein AKJ08_2572 [Vulgatibacter incomptus]